MNLAQIFCSFLAKRLCAGARRDRICPPMRCGHETEGRAREQRARTEAEARAEEQVGLRESASMLIECESVLDYPRFVRRLKSDLICSISSIIATANSCMTLPPERTVYQLSDLTVQCLLNPTEELAQSSQEMMSRTLSGFRSGAGGLCQQCHAG